MKIYDETTREEILVPDLALGYVYDGYIVTGRTEERYEVMEGTVTEDRPEGLRRLIPAQDITEPCQWYHAYTMSLSGSILSWPNKKKDALPG
ncbi:hypothetical protein [uncultured Subdoligranulum sp.]|uniref:hypothetical protein n=1 Tax=uncultured Subdoligranulum sp. TaxID=512298 RepID=UPI0025F35998|nr:hypothetical protein [uncultured Subdoligranulum sp.]